MEHKEIKLDKKKIYSQKSGMNFVEMLYPENWGIRINVDKDNYGGSSYPYTFRISLISDDDFCKIDYFSPRNYTDDHLRQFQNDQIDDYGNILRRFVTIDEYLENWAKSDLKKYQNVKCFETYVPDNMAKLEEEQKSRAEADNRSKGYILMEYSYRELLKSYSFTYNNSEHVRVYSGINEAQHVGQYRTVPKGALWTLDPFSRNTIFNLYSDTIDRTQDGDITYPTVDETRWNVRQLLTLDCRLSDYKYVCNNIFAPIRGNGVAICSDIWNDFEAIKTENSKKYQKIRDGNEHIIHTYDDCAYKSGDHYVTSDSPWDHPKDYEELEKKKY